MRIDGFTLIAQLVNFMILAWFLRRFLYVRIVAAMNEREAAIAAQLAQAAHQRTDADREAELYRERNRQLETQRALTLARAEDEAAVRRQQIIEDARQEAEAAQSGWLEAARAEQQALVVDLRERVSQQVFAIARRALRDLAGVEVEDRVVAIFIERLKKLEPSDRLAIATSIREQDRRVEIRCAFPVAQALREQLTAAVRAELDEHAEVHLTTVPRLSCGIELSSHSHRLAWNVDAYMQGLEEAVFERLNERTAAHAQN